MGSVDEPRTHPAFRAARPASRAWNLAKTALQTTVFWLVFLGLGPWVLVQIERAIGWSAWTFPQQRVVGAVLFVTFGLVNLWSGVAMAYHGRGTPLPLDMARSLVVAGPYRYVRNPMAIGGLGAGIALGVALGSTLTVIYPVLGGLVWNVFVRPIEEHDLEARFGPAFVAYRDAVRCWWPRSSGYRA